MLFFPKSAMFQLFVLPINQFSSESTNSNETTLILSTIRFRLLLISIYFNDQEKGNSLCIISVYSSLNFIGNCLLFNQMHTFGKKTLALQKYFYELVPKVIPMAIITRKIKHQVCQANPTAFFTYVM